MNYKNIFNPYLFKRFFSFKGRIKRRNFVFHIIVVFVIMIISNICYITFSDYGFYFRLIWYIGLWSYFALASQRIHDIGYSSNWLSVVVIAFLSLSSTDVLFYGFMFEIIALILAIIPGYPDANKYGSIPK